MQSLLRAFRARTDANSLFPHDNQIYVLLLLAVQHFLLFGLSNSGDPCLGCTVIKV